MFSESVITAPLPIRLSVMRLPQSWGFDDGVLYFGVTDCCVVSDARVWVNEGVGANFAVVVDYDRFFVMAPNMVADSLRVGMMIVLGCSISDTIMSSACSY